MESGGCEIRIAPPYGYRCECTLHEYGFCSGTPKKCDDSEIGKAGCNSCFGPECCLGNCEGYGLALVSGCLERHFHFRLE